jgi:hypothetical protein
MFAHAPVHTPAWHVRPSNGSQFSTTVPLPSGRQRVAWLPLHEPLAGMHATQP